MFTLFYTLHNFKQHQLRCFASNPLITTNYSRLLMFVFGMPHEKNVMFFSLPKWFIVNFTSLHQFQCVIYNHFRNTYAAYISTENFFFTPSVSSIQIFFKGSPSANTEISRMFRAFCGTCQKKKKVACMFSFKPTM